MPTQTLNNFRAGVVLLASVHLARWAHRFLQPARYKSARGGRGSGKTWAFAFILVYLCYTSTIRAVICRQFASDVDKSAKLAVEGAIRKMGLTRYFKIRSRYIQCTKTGSYIFFAGIERNRENIRGWEDVDIVWVEEAQYMTQATARVLIPTIRKPGSQIWFSWNPENRTDWVWRRFVTNPREGDVSALVNWRDNPWFPDELEEERKSDKIYDPDVYQWIWEGRPNDTGEAQKVLPFRLLEICSEAYRQGRHHGIVGRVECGLDIAESGMNALVARRGPSIIHARAWRSDSIGMTARSSDSYARESGAMRLYYDVGGMGVGVRSYFREMSGRPYQVRPELFGGSVRGPKTEFSYRVLNSEFFARRNAQMAWALKLRAQNSGRLMVGEAVNPAQCLFIDPTIDDFDDFLAQMNQPTYSENLTGKTVIDKVPDGDPSPDKFDASCLAFARDSDNGLRAR